MGFREEAVSALMRFMRRRGGRRRGPHESLRHSFIPQVFAKLPRHYALFRMLDVHQ